MNIGVVGLGNMGAAIAGRLAASALSPVCFDLNEEQRARVREQGIATSHDLAGLSGSDIVVLSLPSPAASQSVVQTLREVLEPAAIIIETSTVNPHDMHGLARVLEGSGIGLVDAAILTGVDSMVNGTATLLTGGEDGDLDRVSSVLDALSGNRHNFGALGTGMAAKVVNNGVAHAVMVVLCEAMAVAEANGVALETMGELLNEPGAGLRRPLTHRILERVAKENYEGGMPMDAARKDSTLILELAQQSHVPLYATQAAHTVYELALQKGLARKDYAAIATLWQQLERAPLPPEA